LLSFTPLYLSFGLPRDFDRKNPTWAAFVNGLPARGDLIDWTHAFYLRHHTNGSVEADPTFGCFYYAPWPGNRVRIHFRNGEGTDVGPLGQARSAERRAELTAMFTHLRQVLPPGATIVGGSWIYNIEAYRRLFPPAFLATAKVGANEYQFIAQWGQFLDRDGEVKPALARSFLDGLEGRATSDSLKDCFPYRVLRLESAIDVFYDFYGIG